MQMVGGRGMGGTGGLGVSSAAPAVSMTDLFLDKTHVFCKCFEVYTFLLVFFILGGSCSHLGSESQCCRQN